MEGFEIINNSNTKFGFTDRIRILFGKSARTQSRIIVDKEVKILKSEGFCSVDEFFPKSEKLQNK